MPVIRVTLMIACVFMSVQQILFFLGCYIGRACVFSLGSSFSWALGNVWKLNWFMFYIHNYLATYIQFWLASSVGWPTGELYSFYTLSKSSFFYAIMIVVKNIVRVELQSCVIDALNNWKVYDLVWLYHDNTVNCLITLSLHNCILFIFPKLIFQICIYCFLSWRHSIFLKLIVSTLYG